MRDHADSAAVITCCGDTLTHLDSKSEIEQLVIDVFHSLKPGGKAIFSFRDYSNALTGDARFIPVKSDENRILTCVLDYSPESVTVTDLLHERTGNAWRQSVSSYQKVRLSSADFVDMVTRAGFVVEISTVINRLITVIAVR